MAVWWALLQGRAARSRNDERLDKSSLTLLSDKSSLTLLSDKSTLTLLFGKVESDPTFRLGARVARTIGREDVARAEEDQGKAAEQDKCRTDDHGLAPTNSVGEPAEKWTAYDPAEWH